MAESRLHQQSKGSATVEQDPIESEVNMNRRLRSFHYLSLLPGRWLIIWVIIWFVYPSYFRHHIVPSDVSLGTWPRPRDSGLGLGLDNKVLVQLSPHCHNIDIGTYWRHNSPAYGWDILLKIAINKQALLHIRMLFAWAMIFNIKYVGRIHYTNQEVVCVLQGLFWGGWTPLDRASRVKYTYGTPTKFQEYFISSKLLLSYHYVISMVRVCSMGISSVNP